jgi:hypothetical protein
VLLLLLLLLLVLVLALLQKCVFHVLWKQPDASTRCA